MNGPTRGGWERGAGILSRWRSLALALCLGLCLLLGQVGTARAGGPTPVVQPTVAPTNTPGPDGHSACIPGNNGTPIPCPQPCSDNGTTMYPPLPSATPTAPPIPTYTPVPPNPAYQKLVVALPNGTVVIAYYPAPLNTSVPLPTSTAIPPDTPTPSAYPGCRWNNSVSGKDSNDGKGCDGWGVSLPIGPDMCFPGVDYYLRPVLVEMGDDVAQLSYNGVQILIGTPRLDTTLNANAAADTSTISGVFATFYNLAGGLLGIMVVLAMVRAFLSSIGRDMMGQLGGVRRAIGGAILYWLLRQMLLIWFPLVNLVAQQVVSAGNVNPGRTLNDALITLVHTPNQAAWMQIAIFAFLVVLAVLMLILVCSRIMGVFLLIALFVVSPLALVTWVAQEFKAISKWWFGTFVAYSLWGIAYALTLDVLAVFIQFPSTLQYSACSTSGGGTGACLQPVAANFIGVIIICSGLIVLFRLPRVMDGLAGALGGSGGGSGITLLPMVTAAAGIVAISRTAPAITGTIGGVGESGVGLVGAARRRLSFGSGVSSAGNGGLSFGGNPGGSGGGFGGGTPGGGGLGVGGSSVGGAPAGTGGSGTVGRGGPPSGPSGGSAAGNPSVGSGGTAPGGGGGGQGSGMNGTSAGPPAGNSSASGVNPTVGKGGVSGDAGMAMDERWPLAAADEAAWAELLAGVSPYVADPTEGMAWFASDETVDEGFLDAPDARETDPAADVGETTVGGAAIGAELAAEIEPDPKRRDRNRGRETGRNTRVAGLFGDILESQLVTGEASVDLGKRQAASGPSFGEDAVPGPACSRGQGPESSETPERAQGPGGGEGSREQGPAGPRGVND